MRAWVLGLLLTTAAFGAGEGFVRTLPAEKFAAAGLHKLTAEELSVLDRLVAAAKAADPAAASAPVGPDWLRALAKLQETAARPDRAEPLETRLVGDYEGWSGRTTFRLENGQVWRQVDGRRRVDGPRSAPAVKVYPGVFGAYWLEVEGVGERVKVEPVRLR